MTIDKNGQLVTKAKIKRADSANLKGIASKKLYRKLTVKCSVMPASFQPQPLANILKQRNDMRKLTLLISGLLIGGIINAQNWELINSNTNKNLNSVHFPTASIGYIAGNYETILKTTEGGNNWNSLTTGIDKT